MATACALTSRALVRTRYPAPDTERRQYNFHSQRAKDESHYTDEDGRALPTDHPQNRIRKKQQDVGDKEHHQKACSPLGDGVPPGTNFYSFRAFI